MNITIIGAINEVTADEWNNLAGLENPFIRYEFLSALETH
ncbi:MAG: peptidogalycan biosysnthesis protein, partial [Gammaproteobacteria bacterium]